ncbi:DUF3710 domain-containing protein [Corynebacterium sp. HMSC074H12]|uniref:DUF3710 domain-containing protein n=1 Tax=Corynebacterium sp. HMSC074H12 TaxID=1739436 RepID=UPI0008AF5784|nr:DUF3710 domain-containing protein [Corynebacterium sp. HMSC074H12]OFQ53433.1 hypothetical protein HMPREF2932_05110 [Corynebacterium sp. HMSC074H12]
MAMWPFGKKKKNSAVHQEEVATEAVAEDTTAVNPAAENANDGAAEAAPEPTAGLVREDEDDTQASLAVKAVAHDAINGDMGPYDGDNVDIAEFNFEDFSVGLLDLGSLRIPLPKGSQVQVEMGQEGPRMLHILTPHGRMTPVAFAAPRTPGQWAESAEDIIKGLEADGFAAHPEDGPWGSEIVGSSEKGGIRIIGVEGPRWMYRLTLAAPAGKEEELAQLGREVVARTFVYRGEDPILAGSSLPVTLPQQLAEQVQQALKERQQQAAQAASADSAAPADTATETEKTAESQAREQLRDLEDNENK